jgi:hypothetical protein
VEVVGRRREEWRTMSCEGERFGKVRQVVICCGRLEKGVLRGRDMFKDFVSRAIGLMIILTRLSIVMVKGDLSVWKSRLKEVSIETNKF